MISQFFSVSRELLLNKYKLSTLAGHKTILGNVREIFVKEFLENILPNDIEYKTGQISDILGNLSNQCDIILQKKSYPRLGIAENNQISFYEFVLSVIEIKSNLNKEALQEASTHKKNIIELGKNNEEIIFNKNVSEVIRRIDLGGASYCVKGIPYFIIAYTGVKKETIQKYLATSQERFQGIINLEKKYAYIDSSYFGALGYYSVENFGKLTKNTGYAIIEGNDVLKYVYFMLNNIFMTKDINKEMVLNNYFEHNHHKNLKEV